MGTRIKRRTGVVHHRWSSHPKMLFAVTGPDGRLFEVAAAHDLNGLWREFAHDLLSTPDDLREGGWRIWPCAVEWMEDDD